MCKATCQNKCQPGAHFKDCGKTINVFHAERTGSNCGDRNTKTARGTERTAQHAPAVKIPVGLGQGLLPRIQAAHEAARNQNAMREACAIASAMASESRKDDDHEPLAALMRHVDTQEHATLQLLKLVERIGLRQWFDGDFVVLSKADAKAIASELVPFGQPSEALFAAIDKAVGK